MKNRRPVLGMVFVSSCDIANPFTVIHLGLPPMMEELVDDETYAGNFRSSNSLFSFISCETFADDRSRVIFN